MNAKNLTRLAIVVLLALSASGEAAAKGVKIGGIYTDLYYSNDGGDLLGTELFVVATQSGWVVFYQHWEGGAGAPTIVPANVNGDRLSFEIPDSYLGGGKYEGRITASGFEGTWRHRVSKGQSRNDPMRLRRKKSYWQ